MCVIPETHPTDLQYKTMRHIRKNQKKNQKLNTPMAGYENMTDYYY